MNTHTGYLTWPSNNGLYREIYIIIYLFSLFKFSKKTGKEKKTIPFHVHTHTIHSLYFQFFQMARINSLGNLIFDRLPILINLRKGFMLIQNHRYHSPFDDAKWILFISTSSDWANLCQNLISLRACGLQFPEPATTLLGFNKDQNRFSLVSSERNLVCRILNSL